MAPDLRAVVAAEHAGNPLPGVEITYPRASARDVNAAMEELFDWFPDHEPSLLSETDQEWQFRLRWAANPHGFVDPGVAATASALYGLSISEIGGYHEVHHWAGRDIVISLVHAWALLAPSLALLRRGGRPLEWIVHVDDHTDLGESALLPAGILGTLRDPIFGETLPIADPPSVEAAIRRGIVNKGNFLTAYLLGYPSARVVHLKEGINEASYVLALEEGVATLGGRSLPRTCFRKRPADHENGSFQQSPTFSVVLPPRGDGVWLDIDLDYFLNRYNGDSDMLHLQAMPAERQQVLAHADRFLVALSGVSWLSKIQAVSIAVSPGFFPADHWAAVITKIQSGVRNLLQKHPLEATTTP